MSNTSIILRNLNVFGLTRSGLEPMIYCTRGEYANHYTIDTVTPSNKCSTIWWEQFAFRWFYYDVRVQLDFNSARSLKKSACRYVILLRKHYPINISSYSLRDSWRSNKCHFYKSLLWPTSLESKIYRIAYCICVLLLSVVWCRKGCGRVLSMVIWLFYYLALSDVERVVAEF
jgi:hypothetical protein